jgi:hypothetical protein
MKEIINPCTILDKAKNKRKFVYRRPISSAPLKPFVNTT